MQTVRSSGRIAAIDILRGIAILGMIMSGQIGWNSGLPAWMFHAQLPPPDHIFNPDNPGITWVDLVFPFFLFSMGAAFPFSLQKKIDNGQSMWSITAGLLKRWFILSFFSIVIANGTAISSSDAPQALKSLFLIGVWGGMFLSFARFRTGRAVTDAVLNWTGVAVLAGMAALEALNFGVRLSIGKIDVIITVLANIALAGGLIWLVTRKSHFWRWMIFLGVFGIKALSSYTGIFSSFPSIPSNLFSFDYLKYLMIAIPGSIAGDMLLAHKAGTDRPCGKDGDAGWKGTAAAFLAISAVILQLWGLFTRHVAEDFMISAAAAIAFVLLTYRHRQLWSDIAGLGFILMLCGIIFDPIDGGITKDWCNISYLLTTAGMAAMTTGFLLFAEMKYGYRGRILAGCGQNPMIAYTAAAFLISPVLYLTGLLVPLNSLTPGSPFWGVMRGVIITGLVAAVAVIFTKLKIYWKS